MRGQASTHTLLGWKDRAAPGCMRTRGFSREKAAERGGEGGGGEGEDPLCMAVVLGWLSLCRALDVCYVGTTERSELHVPRDLAGVYSVVATARGQSRQEACKACQVIPCQVGVAAWSLCM